MNVAFRLIDGPVPQADEPMIESISIKNFRSFEDVKLTKCKTLNVVLGRNASGKTALLEALFLALGSSPELAQRLRGWRLLPTYTPASRVMDRELWSDLFYNLDLSRKISIELKGKSGHERTLNITYDEKRGFIESANPGGPPVSASPIQFEYKRPYEPTQVGRAILLGNQIGYGGVEALNSEVVFFTSSGNLNNHELVDRFSTVGRSRELSSLVDAIRDEFRFIEDIEVYTQFGAPQLYMKIENLPESIPIGLVSSGVTKIVNVLTAIAAHKGGVILLDEIENGIYYERFESLWRSVYSFAKKNNVQIFASSHNEECLKALSNVASEWANDVSFIRFNNAEPRVEQYHGRTMFGAMEVGEIR